MVEPAYILFDGKGGGEFAFGCVTGAIHGPREDDAIEFTGTATTKWRRQAATDGPSCSPTARSKAKSASKVATIFPLSRVDSHFFNSLLARRYAGV